MAPVMLILLCFHEMRPECILTLIGNDLSLLQARLESELQIQSEEARKRQELIKRELDAVRSRQQQLEGTNARLQEKAGDVRKSLRDLTMSEERFYHLRGLPDEELSLRDYVAVTREPPLNSTEMQRKHCCFFSSKDLL